MSSSGKLGSEEQSVRLCECQKNHALVMANPARSYEEIAKQWKPDRDQV